MTDSTGMIHSTEVKDMLAKTYNVMLKNKFDLTNPTQVYRAEVQCMGYHPSDNYCKKFVNELDYIKKVADNQPITTINYARRFWSETDKVFVEVGGIETVVLKTYDRNKTDMFVYEWKNKGESYLVKEYYTIKSENLESSKK
jgi:hypothetical protein